VNGISGLGGITGQLDRAAAAGASGAGFASALSEAIERVNGLQLASGAEIRRLLAGESEDVHRTMMAVQRAELAFEMLLEMRNKVVAAYQEIMRIQV